MVTRASILDYLKLNQTLGNQKPIHVGRYAPEHKIKGVEMKNTIAGLVCLVLIAFGLGTWTGIAIQNHDSHDLAVSKESAAEFRLVEQAWNLTETH